MKVKPQMKLTVKIVLSELEANYLRNFIQNPKSDSETADESKMRQELFNELSAGLTWIEGRQRAHEY